MCRAGIERSKIEVRFQNVTVDAKVRVGSAGLPNFKNAAIGFLEVRLQQQDLAVEPLVPSAVAMFVAKGPDSRPRCLGHVAAQAAYMPACTPDRCW